MCIINLLWIDLSVHINFFIFSYVVPFFSIPVPKSRISSLLKEPTQISDPKLTQQIYMVSQNVSIVLHVFIMYDCVIKRVVLNKWNRHVFWNNKFAQERLFNNQ